MSKTLLQTIFNHDFSHIAQSGDFHTRFFGKTLSPSDLHHVFTTVKNRTVSIDEKTIPAAMHIAGKTPGAPFIVLAQLHGNEPAGLAGIALVMALAEAGKLERDVIVMIGNPLAAGQYFDHWLAHPTARQETRDAYRCGLSEDGKLFPDMNRIPVDFLTRPVSDHHTKRAQELFTVAQHACGILDIHSARGNMLCITDHKHDSELQNSPIRSVLTGLAEAISAHASASVAVKTLKTIMGPLPNIAHQVGIEAGRHEAADSPHNAATFTLALLHTLGITTIEPLEPNAHGFFDAYDVQPRITYADLAYEEPLQPDDHIYMVTSCQHISSLPARSDQLVVRCANGQYAIQTTAAYGSSPAGVLEYAIYQYDEMEAISASHPVAIAIPSGTVFRTKSAFSGIFVSKSALLYDKDPSVGPWPVAANAIGNIKFCYPCNVSRVKLPDAIAS